jgi:hypothetical protein
MMEPSKYSEFKPLTLLICVQIGLIWYSFLLRFTNLRQSDSFSTVPLLRRLGEAAGS